MTSTCVNEDEQAAISRDIPCVGCGYNLRTLSTSGVCPECGHFVAGSLGFFRENMLCLADTRWIRQLRLGTTVMLAAAVGLIAAFGLTAFYLFVGPGLLVFTYSPWLGVAAVWCLGIFLVTAPRPGRSEGAWRRVLRWSARLCGAVAVFAWLLAALVGQGLRAPVSQVLRTTFIVFNYVVLFLSPMMVCWYCRPLGWQGRRPGLSRLNAVLIIPLGIGLVTVSTLVANDLTFRSVSNPWMWLGFVLALYIAAFLAGVWSLVAHRRMFGTILKTRST